VKTDLGSSHGRSPQFKSVSLAHLDFAQLSGRVHPNSRAAPIHACGGIDSPTLVPTYAPNPPSERSDPPTGKQSIA
jgi:hypothetical protein